MPISALPSLKYVYVRGFFIVIRESWIYIILTVGFFYIFNAYFTNEFLEKLIFFECLIELQCTDEDDEIGENGPREYYCEISLAVEFLRSILIDCEHIPKQFHLRCIRRIQ